MKTLVIGAGQAGVSVGHFLKQANEEFLIVDGSQQLGATWRARWDSLSLFTAAKLNNLPGTKFPGDPEHIPGKDEVADYVQAYARKFDLPIELGVEVDQIERDGDKYVVTTGDRQIVADHVVVATGPTGAPRIPDVAQTLNSEIAQFHAVEYHNPEQLPAGPVLVVGAGNSGAEIAIELATSREVWLAGPDVGQLPFKLGGVLYKILNRLLTTDNRFGRKMASKTAGGGTPLVRLKPEDVTNAGVRRVSRLSGDADGRPRLADGTVLNPASVIWCTGFIQDYGWIKLPVFDDIGRPIHRRGVVENEPGLYFLGLPYMYAMESSLIMGVTKDAKYTAEMILSRRAQGIARPS